MHHIVYSDGSMDFRGDVGGYGTAVLDGQEKLLVELRRGFKCTTVNRMEIMGALAGCEWSMNNSATSIQVISDSQYLVSVPREFHQQVDSRLAQERLEAKHWTSQEC